MLLHSFAVQCAFINATVVGYIAFIWRHVQVLPD